MTVDIVTAALAVLGARCRPPRIAGESAARDTFSSMSYPRGKIVGVFVIDSPIGPLSVSVDGDTVVGVRFGAPPGLAAEHPAAAQLAAYFAGELTDFTVPVLMRGSEFERAVWGEIAKIPYGEMVTYGAIATALGDPRAARAVGTACNHNPVPVIVPCHRVVGASGKLVGFGGGRERKRRLLELEAGVALARSWGME